MQVTSIQAKEAWIINNPLQSSPPPSPPWGSHQKRQQPTNRRIAYYTSCKLKLLSLKVLTPLWVLESWFLNSGREHLTPFSHKSAPSLSFFKASKHHRATSGLQSVIVFVYSSWKVLAGKSSLLQKERNGYRELIYPFTQTKIFQRETFKNVCSLPK